MALSFFMPNLPFSWLYKKEEPSGAIKYDMHQILICEADMVTRRDPQVSQ